MQPMKSTEDYAPHQEVVLAHPLDIGSPANPQPVLDASQEPVEEADEATDMDEPKLAPEAGPGTAADAALTDQAADDDEDRYAHW